MDAAKAIAEIDYRLTLLRATKGRADEIAGLEVVRAGWLKVISRTTP